MSRAWPRRRVSYAACATGPRWRARDLRRPDGRRRRALLDAEIRAAQVVARGEACLSCTEHQYISTETGYQRAQRIILPHGQLGEHTVAMCSATVDALLP